MRLPSLRWLRRATQKDAEAILAAAREDDAEDARAARRRILDLAAPTTAPGAALGPEAPRLGMLAAGPCGQDDERVRRNRGRW